VPGGSDDRRYNLSLSAQGICRARHFHFPARLFALFVIVGRWPH